MGIINNLLSDVNYVYKNLNLPIIAKLFPDSGDVLTVDNHFKNGSTWPFGPIPDRGMLYQYELHLGHYRNTGRV